MSFRRKKMDRRHSKRYFSKAASRIHRKNALQGGDTAMRGGIRL